VALGSVLLGDHGAFTSLRKRSGSTWDHRTRNFGSDVTDIIDLTTIAKPPDPSIPQAQYSEVAEGFLMAGDQAMFVFQTSASGPLRADVWTLIGTSSGSTWGAYHVTEDDSFGNFYNQSIDWILT
jgi:hypothetical protein